jgi:hypothetical protein
MKPPLAFTYGIADYTATNSDKELLEALAQMPQWSSGAQLLESDPDAFYQAASVMGISAQELAETAYKIMAPTAKAVEAMLDLGIALDKAYQVTKEGRAQNVRVNFDL